MKEISEEEQYKLDLMRKLIRENEEKMETPEYIAECARIEKMCDVIKAMPMTTLEETQAAKEASRSIPNSSEKVLLFKFILYYEDRLKWPCIPIGTKVRVKKNLRIDEQYGDTIFQENMNYLKGKEAIITGVSESHNGGAPYVYCLNKEYYYSPQMFDVIV